MSKAATAEAGFHPSSQRIIIMLGMHRSGTSCLAGALENAGVQLGKVSRRNLHNPKGNLESKKITALHDALLRFNHGSWDNPPPKTAWPQELKAERDRIIQSFRGIPLWGFKDPRALLTLDGWLDALPGPGLSFAGSFRHPSAVAKSLFRRDSIPYARGISLWKIYNEKLLFYHHLFKFPVISFDLPDSEYKNKIKKLLRILVLAENNHADDDFENRLRHYDEGPDIALPNDIRAVYEKLNRIAI